MDLLCRDDVLNISTAYLRPGFAFGGSCLPKDLRALNYLARGADVELPLLESLLPSNAIHIGHAAELVMGHTEMLKSGGLRKGLLWVKAVSFRLTQLFRKLLAVYLHRTLSERLKAILKGYDEEKA